MPTHTHRSLEVAPECPTQFEGALSEMYCKLMLPVMPRIEAVEHIHTRLREYCEDSDALLLLRAEKKQDRGRSWIAPDGTTIRWTDNSPASAMHQAAFSDQRWTRQEFRQLIRSLPIRIFDRQLPINNAGYYVAHIMAVKPDRTSWRILTKTERIARFVRNVHPANHFFVPNRPKGTGKRYGEDPSVIAFIAGQHRDRYACIWNEFLKLANASDIVSPPGVFDRIAICFGDPPKSSAAAIVKSKATRIVRESQPQHESIFVAGARDCCVPLSESDLREGYLDWIGNDQSEKRQHGAVTMSEGLDLKLAWRNSRGAPPKAIGCYRLNLRALLALGYVRLDKSTEPDRIRLQFVHENDGGIYIRVRKDTPRLFVGSFNEISR